MLLLVALLAVRSDLSPTQFLGEAENEPAENASAATGAHPLPKISFFLGRIVVPLCRWSLQARRELARP